MRLTESVPGKQEPQIVLPWKEENDHVDSTELEGNYSHVSFPQQTVRNIKGKDNLKGATPHVQSTSTFGPSAT